MQSLAEVEPVVLDASFECALGLPGLVVEKSLPLPPVNSGVAERFKAAMSQGFIAPSEFRRMVLAVDSSEKTLRTVEDFKDKPVCVVGKLAENKVVHTAEAVPHSPIHVAKDLPEEVVNTIKDSLTTVSYVTEDLTLRTVESSPEKDSSVVVSAPEPDHSVFRRDEIRFPSQSTNVDEGLPENKMSTVDDSLDVSVRVVGSLPENKVFAVGDFPDRPVRVVGNRVENIVHAVEDTPYVPVSVTGNLAENKVRPAEVVSHAPVHVTKDFPEEVLSTVKNPSATESFVTEDYPLRTVKGSRVAEELIVPSAPKEVLAQKVRVLPNVPETPFVREVRVVKSILPDQTQIIAPAPLPIELPAAPVHRQELAPAAPLDVTRMLVTAAEAVADAILVSSGFSNGEGSIIVRLQPEVLGGSEVRIVVKDGTLSVVINAATQDVHEIVEANRTQFEQHLADKVHSWRISVAVRRGGKLDERI